MYNLNTVMPLTQDTKMDSEQMNMSHEKHPGRMSVTERFTQGVSTLSLDILDQNMVDSAIEGMMHQWIENSMIPESLSYPEDIQILKEVIQDTIDVEDKELIRLIYRRVMSTLRSKSLHGSVLVNWSHKVDKNKILERAIKEIRTSFEK